jgi:hypothetical protein
MYDKFHARYARGNFKNVTIDLAIHSHSAPIFRLRCISIAQKKSYIYSGGFKGGFGGFIHSKNHFRVLELVKY